MNGLNTPSGRKRIFRIHIDMAELSLEMSADRLVSWIGRNGINVLNVAGPEAAKIRRFTRQQWIFLKSVFSA